MFTKNVFLTATAAPDTTATTAPDAATTAATAETAPATVEGGITLDTEAIKQAFSGVSPENLEKIGEGGENITIDQNGSMVVVDPVTGVATPIQDLGVDMTALQSALGIDTSILPQAPKEMSGLVTGLYVGYGIVCVILIALVLSQNKRSAAFGNGMSNGQQSYWSKNKKHSKEGKMDFYTKFGIAVFMALTFVITLL